MYTIKFISFLFLLFASTCDSLPRPGSSLNDVKFSIFPYISLSKDKFFLKYQIKKTDDAQSTLVRVVYCDTTNNKAYYYFSSPISHFEKENLIVRSLDSDGLTDYAKRDCIFWLNADMTEVKLIIKKEE